MLYFYIIKTYYDEKNYVNKGHVNASSTKEAVEKLTEYYGEDTCCELYIRFEEEAPIYEEGEKILDEDVPLVSDNIIS